MNQDILLMLLNIESLLGGKGKVSKDTAEGATKKLNKIKPRIADYLTRKEKVLPPTGGLSIKDWNTIKSRVSQEMDQDKITAWLESLPADVNPEDAVVAVNELLPKLRPLLPINASVTLTGYDEREPSDYEKSKFVRQMRILENPLLILDLIDSDALTGTEVDALRTFYPTLYDAISAAIVESLSELAGKNNGKQNGLSLNKNRTLSLFLDVPRVSPTQMQLYQKDGAADSDKAKVAEISSPANQPTEQQRLSSK